MGWTGMMMESKMSKPAIKDFVKSDIEKEGHKVVKMIVRGECHYMLVEMTNGETILHNTIAYCDKVGSNKDSFRWELMYKDVNPIFEVNTPISLVRALMKVNGSTPELEQWLESIKANKTS